MTRRLLLDEMFPRGMADQLCAKGHDVRAVVASQEFAGLVMVSTKTFPRNRSYVTAVTSALDALLAMDDGIPREESSSWRVPSWLVLGRGGRG